MARHIAALRRQGWTTAQAVAMATERVPPGTLRRRLEAVGAALARGEALSQGDPIVALLARGEAAGPDALDSLADGLSLSAEADQAARQGLWLLQVGGVGLSALLFLGGWLATAYRAALPGSQWGPDLAILEALTVFRWLAPLGLVASWALLGRFWRTPGSRELQAASTLAVYAAARRAGQDEAAATALAAPHPPHLLDRLDAYERGLWSHLREADGDVLAAAAVSDALRGVGRRRLEAFRRQAPVWSGVVLFLALTSLLPLLILPTLRHGATIG